MTSPIYCEKCHKPIFWRDKLPYNARQTAGEYYPTDEKHFNSCPYYVRKRTERDCPAHLIELSGNIDTIFKVNVDLPRCLYHIERGYFEVEKWGKVQRFSTQDLYHLKKSLAREAKREEKKLEKLRAAGLDRHPLDQFVFDG